MRLPFGCEGFTADADIGRHGWSILVLVERLDFSPMCGGGHRLIIRLRLRLIVLWIVYLFCTLAGWYCDELGLTVWTDDRSRWPCGG